MPDGNQSSQILSPEKHNLKLKVRADFLDRFGYEGLRPRQRPSYQASYLYALKKRPCPAVVLLNPVDPTWKTPSAWGGIIGKRFRVSLISELSGSLVAE